MTDPSASGTGFNSVTIPSPGNGVAAGIMSKPLVFDQNALFGAPYDPGLNVVAGGGIQGGLTGALFREFAFTLAGAVIVSGIVALTLSPMMGSKLLRAGDTEKGFAGWINRQRPDRSAAATRLGGRATWCHALTDQ